MNHGTPLFQHLMQTFRELSEEEQCSPEGSALFTEIMIHAPQEFKDLAASMAKEVGLMPQQPYGYDDNGEAVYSIEQMAAQVGITLKEAKEHARAFMATRERMGLPPIQLFSTTNVHRVQ